jgi:alkanesulfonate monooxygenase SsuD/methylene tetrahydromethanopterin reductase-like flavin-dependent oxidoreductase (luciferase family)
MDVGIQLVFARYGWDGLSDDDVYREEITLARLAEDLGYDVLWSAEHHFFDYSMCPDNVQILTYLAGVTKTVELGTAAVILPWNDPLRVAERIAVLDQLSGGRVRLGFGRGLSRREFAAFEGIGLAESRDRFDESAAMIIEALETGWIEGAGPYYPQARIAIRPRPQRSFRDRFYAVASSDDSIESAARLGARMVMFADRHWEARLPGIERWRSRYREVHGTEPPPPMTADFVYCHPDREVADERVPRYLGTYLASLVEHYELMGEHFAEARGYEAYANASGYIRKIGESGLLQAFLRATSHGTPDQVIEALDARRKLIGPFELAVSFRFGGIPFDEAEAAMRLFAREVLPVLKTW